MKRFFLVPIFLTGMVMVALGSTARAADPHPNVLFIAIDDLRNDVGSMDASHAKTAQLDAFARTARPFTHHYVQVPTCGASRLALLRGTYPTKPAHLSNGGIHATCHDWREQSLPAMFRQAGYRTLSLGKITHYPGGQTGKAWATGPEELPGVWDRAWVPDGPWKSPQAMMHGYANGVARQPGRSPPLEAYDGPDDAYPDALVAADAVATLEDLAHQKEPWFFGVGFFKPHLPFAAPKRWHDLHGDGVPDLDPALAVKPSWPSGWHASGEFRGNYGHNGRDPATALEYARQLRIAYAASVSYTDAQVGRVLEALEANGLADSTIVVVWGDHGFLLGEHAIWGKHCLFEESLRSPLLIRYPGLAAPGEPTATIVETVDIFPTLADLCSLPAPKTLDGQSLRPQLDDPAAASQKPARGFWTGDQKTIRTDRWRLIMAAAKGDAPPRIELFDYEHDPLETKNVAADHPDVVQDLLAVLQKATATPLRTGR